MESPVSRRCKIRVLVRLGGVLSSTVVILPPFRDLTLTLRLPSYVPTRVIEPGPLKVATARTPVTRLPCDTSLMSTVPLITRTLRWTL